MSRLGPRRRDAIRERSSLEDYRGLARRHPWAAGLLAVFMLALTGIPPLSGFWAKYYVFLAGIQAGLTWLVVVAVISSVISAFFYLRVLVVAYLQEPVGEARPRPRPAGPRPRGRPRPGRPADGGHRPGPRGADRGGPVGREDPGVGVPRPAKPRHPAHRRARRHPGERQGRAGPGRGALSEAVATADPFVQEAASYLVAAGGKRLRPTWS